MGATHVGIAAIAKPSTVKQPYAVANEVCVTALARAMLLPAPPVVIAEHDGVKHSVSLNFNLTGVDLPPADCEALVAAHPGLAAGIILFDEWVLNHDRHPENIAYDEDSDTVQIFDHGHAFRPDGTGADVLDARRGHTALLAADRWGNPLPHCLVPYLTSLDALVGWHERLMQVPEFMIAQAVRAGCDLGWPDSDYDVCMDVLLERRQTVLQIIGSNRHLFTSVPPELPLQPPAAPEAPAPRAQYLRRPMRRRPRPVRRAAPASDPDRDSLAEGQNDGG